MLLILFFVCPSCFVDELLHPRVKFITTNRPSGGCSSHASQNSQTCTLKPQALVRKAQYNPTTHLAGDPGEHINQTHDVFKPEKKSW
jgi:hypothetical protein